MQSCSLLKYFGSKDKKGGKLWFSYRSFMKTYGILKQLLPKGYGSSDNSACI
jgi:hypothetical protein